MGFFRMGQCAPRRAMDPEEKTSFPPGAPASFPDSRCADFLRNGAGGPTVSSDRAAGLGWQRPPPLGERMGAGCSARDVRLQPHIRNATLDSLDRGAIEHRVGSNSGHQQVAFGREYSSTTGRPPGAPLHAVKPRLRVRVHGGRAKKGCELDSGFGGHKRKVLVLGGIREHADLGQEPTMHSSKSLLTPQCDFLQQEEARHDSKHDQHPRGLRQEVVPARCVESHCGKSGVLEGLSRSEGNPRRVKCRRGQPPLCLWARVPVLGPGAVLAQRAGCHCGETLWWEVTRGSKGDPRCVKCHRGQPLLYLGAIKSVVRPGAAFAQSVKCHCGQSLGVVRQEHAAMSKQNVWAKEALKHMEEQRKSEMPGMLVAKQKATQNARDGKADRAAQHKEARQLREAEEVRNVQESLQMLSLDLQWKAAAQAWGDDGALLEKISACARQMGVGFKRDDAQGVVLMVAAALTAGKGLRAAAIRALETNTGPPYALLLEPVTNVDVQPTALAGELACGYPGTKLVLGSSRKMGADGKLPEAPAPRNGRNQVLPFPQVPGRDTYVMKVETVSDTLLQEVVKGNPIKIGQEEFDAHMLPINTRGMLQMEISRDSQARMHILMTQMAMLGLKPMQVESALLHMIRVGMGAKGQKIWDMYIDREGTAIIDKDTRKLIKVIGVRAPFADAQRDVRQAYKLPASIAAKNSLGAAPRIWIIGDEQDMGLMKSQGGALCSVSTGMGMIEMSVRIECTYEGAQGLAAAVQRVEKMSSAAITGPREWLQKMLALAREQGATAPEKAHHSFCDENITILYARAIAHAHPDVQAIVRGVVQEWSRLRQELHGLARGGITGNKAWTTLVEILQQALDEVGKVDQTLITIQVSIGEGAWREMFGVPKTMQQPPIEFLEKQLHWVVEDTALQLAAYTLILISNGTDTSTAWVQGLRGQDGGPVFIGKLWATATTEARTRYAAQGRPNTLIIPLARGPGRVLLRATLIDDANNITVGVTAETKTALKQALLRELDLGGGIFVPKKIKTGAINQLTGPLSECEGIAGGTWDVRHEKFEGINLLPAEAWDGAVMPTVLEMIKDGLVAPAVSSEKEDSDTIVYMASLFAAAIDLAVLNNQFSWAGIQFGTDIRKEVTDSLQHSFVTLLCEQVRTGVWVHKDMVVAGHEAGDNEEIAPDQIVTAKRGLNRVMATHPFKGGAVAKQVITELIQMGTITIVGAEGAGIMVLLPDMKDVITIIKTQGNTIAPLGEAINYNDMQLSMNDWVALMDKIGRDILDHMHQASMTFLWLLGLPDQVTGPKKAQECPITAQHSELEKFHPLVMHALPNSIWNSRGVFLMQALDELCRRDLVGILRVPNSKLGRMGLVVVRGDKGLRFSSTFGEEVEPDDVEDILNGLPSKVLSVQGGEAPLGDNERMEGTLGMLKMRITVTRLDEALLQPKVLLGVRVTDELKLAQAPGADMEDLDTALDLISAVKADVDIITKLVEKKMQSKRFKETHEVWNCAGGVFILPHQMIPKDIDDVASRVSLWNPAESSIEDLWRPPVTSAGVQDESALWADMESPRADPDEGQVAASSELVRMECSWKSELAKRTAQDMTTASDAVRDLREREKSDPQSLQTVEVNASNTHDSQEFNARNATLINEEEWATSADAVGPVTLTIRLKQTAQVVGICLLHGEQGKIFTQVEVQARQGNQKHNLVTIPPKDAEGGPHHLWLQHPIQGREFDLIFNADSVLGDSGSAGLKYVALAGYVSEPGGDDEQQGSKRKKKK